MSGDDKNLQETVSEALKETQETLKTEETETKEELSEETTGETEAGETPDYVSGIDISDIPEQDRPKFKEKLLQKASLLEKGYQEKFKEVASFKKAQDELIRQGLTVEEAQNVLIEYLERKRNPEKSTQKKEAIKTLDKLLETVSYEQRPAMEQLRKIILEETEVDKLRQEIKQLNELVGELRGETTTSKTQRVSQYVDSLIPKFGRNLIDKYREEFVNAHLAYKIPLEKLIQSVVPFDELEQAILTKGKKPLTEEKKAGITSKPSGVSSATEKIDIKSTKLVDVIKHVLK